MFFRNRKQSEAAAGLSVNKLTQALLLWHTEMKNLRHEIITLRTEMGKWRVSGQSVPTNGRSPLDTGGNSAVRDWMPIVDRFQELLLVQLGNADLAQAFGTYARQRELRDAEMSAGLSKSASNEMDAEWEESVGGQSKYESI